MDWIYFKLKISRSFYPWMLTIIVWKYSVKQSLKFKSCIESFWKRFQQQIFALPIWLNSSIEEKRKTGKYGDDCVNIHCSSFKCWSKTENSRNWIVWKIDFNQRAIYFKAITKIYPWRTEITKIVSWFPRNYLDRYDLLCLGCLELDKRRIVKGLKLF